MLSITSPSLSLPTSISAGTKLLHERRSILLALNDHFLSIFRVNSLLLCESWTSKPWLAWDLLVNPVPYDMMLASITCGDLSAH